MKFPMPGWTGSALVLLMVLPVAAYLGVSQSVWKEHLKTTVTNDPRSGLERGLSTVRSALDRKESGMLLTATRLADKESLKKLLSARKLDLPRVKSLMEASFDPKQTPLLVLADEKGGALFTSIPLPTPATPKPTLSRHGRRHHPSGPSLPSVKDWSGLRQALRGESASGIFSYQGRLYLAAAVPVKASRRVGALLAGEPFADSFGEDLKQSAQADVAFYSDRQILFSTLAVVLENQVLKALPSGWPSSGVPPSRPMTIDQSPCLWGSLPVSDINGDPLGRLLVFQPITQMQTLEGRPQERVLKLGGGLVLALLLLGLSIAAVSRGRVRRLAAAVEGVRDGDWTTPLPRLRGQLGRLARTLQDLVESLKEKERVSLILGKVVDPQAARRILAEKDYFSIRGERRECTLLQADLKAFNTLSENMAPEALVEALNLYFSLINEAVFKYEGMLDKFIGDTAVAVWGAPFSHEDKEERAVRAALEIQQSLRDFNISRIKKGHPPFTIGIGIHTGTVVSGNLGSDKRYDYSIIGEPLHVASRLCAMAAPGQTVVSGETYEKTKTLVKASPLNPIAVKGSMEPLPTFEITQLV